MNISRILYVADTHTMGEPTRVILSGVPVLRGNSLAEKQQYFLDHYDFLRKAALYEPRGHNDMFGALLVPPTLPEADIGAIFLNRTGVENMCGHATIACATIAVEFGLVEKMEPTTIVKIETPAGLVEAVVSVKNGNVQDVTYRNVPSFVYRENVALQLEDFGTVTADIVYGGNFFALVDAEKLNVSIDASNSDVLCRIGMAAMRAVNQQYPVVHPLYPHINECIATCLYSASPVDGVDLRKITVFGDGCLDRSPCGTGTSALMAMMYAKGKLQIGERFVSESFIGTTFHGKVLGELNEGGLAAADSELTGSAYVVGLNQLLFNEDDPVNMGFSVK